VLVVDDDRPVRDAVRRALALSGYDVRIAEGGRVALAMMRQRTPDILLLDLMMPEPDGLAVCRRLREGGDRVPILMLTARDAIGDRVAGLDAGADDYLAKPFDIDELKARVRALLRRTGDEGPDRALRFGGLEIHPDRHGAMFEGRLAELTRTEYQLLELLMRNPRRVLPASVIYERVWGYDFGVTSNALRVYVRYLRRKLATLGAPELIHTVRGVGYVLREVDP
jgi:two-component system response regulator MprA